MDARGAGALLGGSPTAPRTVRLERRAAALGTRLASVAIAFATGRAMSDSREPNIRWSGGDDGVYIAIVEGRMAAVVYWSEDDREWRWVAADRPFEHFLVTHAEPQKHWLVMFTAEAVIRSYLLGADPVDASDRKSYIQEQADEESR